MHRVRPPSPENLWKNLSEGPKRTSKEMIQNSNHNRNLAPRERRVKCANSRGPRGLTHIEGLSGIRFINKTDPDIGRTKDEPEGLGQKSGKI